MKSSRRTATTRLADLKCPKCCKDDILLSLNCGHLICRECSTGLKICYVCQKSILGVPQLWPQHIHAKRLVDISKNTFSKAQPCQFNQNKRKRPRQALSDDESNKIKRPTKAKTNFSQNKCVTITDSNLSETPLIIDGHIPVEVRRSSRFSNSNETTYYYPRLKSLKSLDANDSGFLSLSRSRYSNTSDFNIKYSPSISSFIKTIQKTDLKSNHYVRLGGHGPKLKTPSKPNCPIVVIKHIVSNTSAYKWIECGVQVTPDINSVFTQTEQISLDLSGCKDKIEDPLVLNLNVQTENVSNQIKNRQKPKIQIHEIPIIVDSVNLDSDSDSNGETPYKQTTNNKNCLAIESSSEDEEKKNTPLTNDTETSSSDEDIDSSSKDRSLVPFKFKGRTRNETLLSQDYMQFEIKTGDLKHPFMKSDLENFVVKMFQQSEPPNDISVKRSESPSLDKHLHPISQVSSETQSISMTENSDSMTDLLELNDTPRWVVNALERNKRIMKKSIILQVHPNPLEKIFQHIPNILEAKRVSRHSYKLKTVPRVMNLIDVTLEKFEQLKIDSRPTINPDCVQHQLRLRLQENEDCIVFADDGLQPEERLDLMEYIQSHDFKYSETVNINTSYLIVRNQFDIESMKTIKFLMAVAHKKPIVTTDYIYNSIRYDRLLSISDYVLKLPGPQSCTLLTRLPIFSEFVFHVSDGLLNPSTEEIKELLITCGAKLVKNLEDIFNFMNRCKVQIINVSGPEFETIYPENENSITRVDFGWVRESVFHYELIPLEQYVPPRGTVQRL